MKKIALSAVLALSALCLWAEPDEGRLDFTFSTGGAAVWLTRIIYQENRSNFVFRDFLPGIYFGAELRNIPYIVPAFRLTVLYPLITSFNNMVQKPNTPLHFGADLYAGLRFEREIQDELRLHIGPGMRLFFLTSDRWNYLNLGAVAAAGLELPLTPKLTLLLDGAASIHNSNLGDNRAIEPFDIAWQYQAGLGMRYRRDPINTSPLFTAHRRSAINNGAIREQR